MCVADVTGVLGSWSPCLFAFKISMTFVGHEQGDGSGDTQNSCTNFTKTRKILRLHFRLTKKTHKVQEWNNFKRDRDFLSPV